MSKYEIYLENCYRKIKDIPDNSVDLILTDPPYNLSQYSRGNITLDWRESDINNDIADWDRVEFSPFVIAKDFTRILKPTGNIFAFTAQNLFGQWHEAFDPIFDTFQFFVWHKTNPVPKFRKAGFLNSCELIVCMWDKSHVWNFTQQNKMHNFFESPICMGNERLDHPTQKPISVLKHIIQVASEEKGVVFDPFMGVGSTGIASLQLDRIFIGIEKEEKYFLSAQKRLEEQERQLAEQIKLF